MCAAQRLTARENLLVAAINIALTRKLLTLELKPVPPTVFDFELFGLPIIGYVAGVGFGEEVLVQVIARPTAQGRQSVYSISPVSWREDGEASAVGHLERHHGKYLAYGEFYNGTRKITAELSALKVEPLGFGVERWAMSYAARDAEERSQRPLEWWQVCRRKRERRKAELIVYPI
jgi:hypothetical protein